MLSRVTLISSSGKSHLAATLWAPWELGPSVRTSSLVRCQRGLVLPLELQLPCQQHQACGPPSSRSLPLRRWPVTSAVSLTSRCRTACFAFLAVSLDLKLGWNDQFCFLFIEGALWQAVAGGVVERKALSKTPSVWQIRRRSDERHRVRYRLMAQHQRKKDIQGVSRLLFLSIYIYI